MHKYIYKTCLQNFSSFLKNSSVGSISASNIIPLRLPIRIFFVEVSDEDPLNLFHPTDSIIMPLLSTKKKRIRNFRRNL